MSNTSAGHPFSTISLPKNRYTRYFRYKSRHCEGLRKIPQRYHWVYAAAIVPTATR
jgi:hypothetical protein